MAKSHADVADIRVVVEMLKDGSDERAVIVLERRGKIVRHLLRAVLRGANSFIRRSQQVPYPGRQGAIADVRRAVLPLRPAEIAGTIGDGPGDEIHFLARLNPGLNQAIDITPVVLISASGWTLVNP